MSDSWNESSLHRGTVHSVKKSLILVLAKLIKYSIDCVFGKWCV